ncbi:MAG: hypothetical protein FWF15_03005 [Oscillospiraceae bacterium]|nr:hypothetical protein [Oscillospiraceae bacterium]
MKLEKIKNIPEEDLPEVLNEIGRVKGRIPKSLKRQFVKPARRYRLIPVMAIIALIMCVSLAVVAAPAIMKLFYVPGEGLVEQYDEEPIYLLLSDDSYMPEHDIKYGYWYNGNVYLYVLTKLYPQFENNEEMTLKIIGYKAGEYNVETLWRGVIGSLDDGYHKYILKIEGVDLEIARNGFELKNDSLTGILCFDKIPAEYTAYQVTRDDVQLTLIPMSEEHTEFIIETAFTDCRNGELIPSHYSFSEKNSIYVHDTEGNKYPLVEYGEIYIVDEIPEFEITGFECNELVLLYHLLHDYTTVTIPIPESGEILDVDIDIVLSNGKIKGKITNIGRNVTYFDSISFIKENNDYSFPKGSLTIVTSSMYDGRKGYGIAGSYNQEYWKFLEPFMTNITGGDPLTMFERMQEAQEEGNLIYTSRQYRDKTGSYFTNHYIHDGKDTVDINIYGCEIYITDDWNISFK